MTGRTVLDSSVIATLFFPEDMTTRTIRKLGFEPYLTVDSAVADAAQVAAKRLASGADSPDDVKEMLHDAIYYITELCDPIPSAELIDPALDLACELNISLYDALFVAAAVREREALFTADKELGAIAKKVCRVRVLE
ncbi:type II toxin-antitoxin system VapC family toxin [Methanoregula sp.]|jgi:predicted nucleic acid-binding protein|uniref:type II toxin-antitoxin system VapC family toxin n=1 Tax=Methanoregula sp. TaxID=2052170 RepID=UPI002619EA5F|nr:type II toxin-antitoxin system VapC family toxin [Methanoregula sp.]MDD5141912.1 type II toxin-antitoxin system VapC family toxin [Methanoregula sp.]